MKKIFIGIMVGLSFSACASLAFNYGYYVLDLESQRLNAKNPSDDLPLSVCKKDEAGYHCITMEIGEFYRLKADKEKADLRIEQLERNCE